MTRLRPVAGTARALLRILVLFAALYLCIANTAAPCLEIEEPRSSGAVGIDIVKKDMPHGVPDEPVFRLSSPASSFTLKHGAEPIFEVTCDGAAGNCIPRKFKVTCEALVDMATQEAVASLAVADAEPAGADAGQAEDAADMPSPPAGSGKARLDAGLVERCRDKGIFGDASGLVAVARTAEGAEGSSTFTARMVPAPGYLSCDKHDFKKCADGYK
jgi:hypothetical protein